ncbi:hypothetical protein BHQ29_07375 [Pseudomonas sp. LPH1]|nr:hypothetical protein BHQ29_07375 [Pseudomonas sp. LPH1]
MTALSSSYPILILNSQSMLLKLSWRTLFFLTAKYSKDYLTAQNLFQFFIMAIGIHFGMVSQSQA